MKCHVQKHSKYAQRSSEAEGQHHDPTVVNAGIGQHTPEVLLNEDEWNGNRYRKQPEENQEMRSKLGPETYRTQNGEPHATIESAVEDTHGEHRFTWDGCCT